METLLARGARPLPERLFSDAFEIGERLVEVPEEEAEVWQVFDAQPPEMQQGMLERYGRAALGGYGVLEEARCRLR